MVFQTISFVPPKASKPHQRWLQNTRRQQPAQALASRTYGWIVFKVSFNLGLEIRSRSICLRPAVWRVAPVGPRLVEKQYCVELSIWEGKHFEWPMEADVESSYFTSIFSKGNKAIWRSTVDVVLKHIHFQISPPPLNKDLDQKYCNPDLVDDLISRKVGVTQWTILRFHYNLYCDHLQGPGKDDGWEPGLPRARGSKVVWPCSEDKRALSGVYFFKALKKIWTVCFWCRSQISFSIGAGTARHLALLIGKLQVSQPNLRGAFGTKMLLVSEVTTLRFLLNLGILKGGERESHLLKTHQRGQARQVAKRVGRQRNRGKGMEQRGKVLRIRPLLLTTRRCPRPRLRNKNPVQ